MVPAAKLNLNPLIERLLVSTIIAIYATVNTELAHPFINLGAINKCISSRSRSAENKGKIYQSPVIIKLGMHDV